MTTSPTPPDAAIDRADGPDEWDVGLAAWLQRAGRTVIGSEQLELLEAVDRCRSISAAAREKGVHFRRAWQLIHDMNEAAGRSLVTTAAGGPRGGGAELTALGRRLTAGLRALRDDVPRLASGLRSRLVERTAAAVHVLAAVSLEEVLARLLTDFAAVAPDVCVRTLYGASDELANHLLAGSPGCLFLTADPGQLDRLKRARLIRRESTAPLAENGLAAVACGGDVSSIHRPADLRTAGVGPVALAGPDCPLGRYSEAYLRRMKLYDHVSRRAVRVDNARAVLSAVRAGQAELGFVYSSEAQRAEGCRILFRAGRTPVPIRYFGAVLDRGSDPRWARRLLDYLASSAAARRFRECGFLPSRRR
ncbi:MAG TPA: molybdate ABC transporter substrate-binding protein [Gemmataceae bacterium]|nr:molybdate ABC transporter substrate-binding protein [Gemmataceae bacterium]